VEDNERFNQSGRVVLHEAAGETGVAGIGAAVCALGEQFVICGAGRCDGDGGGGDECLGCRAANGDNATAGWLDSRSNSDSTGCQRCAVRTVGHAAGAVGYTYSWCGAVIGNSCCSTWGTASWGRCGGGRHDGGDVGGAEGAGEGGGEVF
jgi:hypothetical protein